MASLLSGISQRLQAHGVYLLLAIAALILINPQTINIATLYSGSVMIVGMIFSSMILPDSSPPKEIKSLLMKSIPVAIFISALIALKTTLIVFAVLFFFLYFLILLIFINDKKLVIITTIMIAALVLLLLLPWIAIYRDNYWGIIQNILYTNQPDLFSGSNYSSRSLITKSWFSSNRLYWGGSFLGYNILMLIMLMFSLLAAYASTKKKTVLPKPYLLAVLIACVVTIANYFITAFFWDPDTQIRYSCPVLIAILPLAILILGKQYDIPKSDVSVVACKGIFDRFRIPSVMLLILIIMVVFFGPALLERMSLVYHRRTVLAFPLPMGYIGFNTTMFTEAARNDIRNVQNKTEENQKILAWVSVPFHLDFSRNKIFTVSEPGICNPWLRFPLNGSTEDIRKFIKDMGIRYVIWEYKGAALKKESEFNSYLRSPFLIYRKIAVYNLYFRKMLKALAEENRVIYNQNGIVIIDIQ